MKRKWKIENFSHSMIIHRRHMKSHELAPYGGWMSENFIHSEITCDMIVLIDEGN